jgi:hypothetical protein
MSSTIAFDAKSIATTTFDYFNTTLDKCKTSGGLQKEQFLLIDAMEKIALIAITSSIAIQILSIRYLIKGKLLTIPIIAVNTWCFPSMYNMYRLFNNMKSIFLNISEYKTQNGFLWEKIKKDIQKYTFFLDLPMAKAAITFAKVLLRDLPKEKPLEDLLKFVTDLFDDQKKTHS